MAGHREDPVSFPLALLLRKLGAGPLRGSRAHTRGQIDAMVLAKRALVHVQPVEGIVVAPNGKWVVTYSRNGGPKVWSRALKLVGVLRMPIPDRVHAVVISPNSDAIMWADGKSVATAAVCCDTGKPLPNKGAIVAHYSPASPASLSWGAGGVACCPSASSPFLLNPGVLRLEGLHGTTCAWSGPLLCIAGGGLDGKGGRSPKGKIGVVHIFSPSPQPSSHHGCVGHAPSVRLTPLVVVKLPALSVRVAWSSDTPSNTHSLAVSSREYGLCAVTIAPASDRSGGWVLAAEHLSSFNTHSDRTGSARCKVVRRKKFRRGSVSVDLTFNLNVAQKREARRPLAYAWGHRTLFGAVGRRVFQWGPALEGGVRVVSARPPHYILHVVTHPSNPYICIMSWSDGLLQVFDGGSLVREFTIDRVGEAMRRCAPVFTADGETLMYADDYGTLSVITCDVVNRKALSETPNQQFFEEEFHPNGVLVAVLPRPPPGERDGDSDDSSSSDATGVHVIYREIEPYMSPLEFPDASSDPLFVALAAAEDSPFGGDTTDEQVVEDEGDDDGSSSTTSSPVRGTSQVFRRAETRYNLRRFSSSSSSSPERRRPLRQAMVRAIRRVQGNYSEDDEDESNDNRRSDLPPRAAKLRAFERVSGRAHGTTPTATPTLAAPPAPPPATPPPTPPPPTPKPSAKRAPGRSRKPAAKRSGARKPAAKARRRAPPSSSSSSSSSSGDSSASTQETRPPPRRAKMVAIRRLRGESSSLSDEPAKPPRKAKPQTQSQPPKWESGLDDDNSEGSSEPAPRATEFLHMLGQGNGRKRGH